MKFRMDKIVREVVEDSWDDARLGRGSDFEHCERVFIETLIQLESEGKAMRFLDSRGRIAWRATQGLRDYIRDQEIDARDELEQDA